MNYKVRKISLLVCIFFCSFLYSQQKILTIDIDGINPKNKSLNVDSVFINAKLLLATGESKNDYIIPENISKIDTLIPMYIYIYETKYIIQLHKAFKTNCSLPYNMSFYYYKRKLYYRLTDCTSIQNIGPLKMKKISEKK